MLPEERPHVHSAPITRVRQDGRRKLPAELMAIAIVVLGLFAGGTLCDAVRKTLLKRPPVHGHQLKTTPFIETVRIY